MLITTVGYFYVIVFFQHAWILVEPFLESQRRFKARLLQLPLSQSRVHPNTTSAAYPRPVHSQKFRDYDYEFCIIIKVMQQNANKTKV